MVKLHTSRQFGNQRYNLTMSNSVRVDKWLWASRFFKTRALARDAVKGGKVQIEGGRAKPGRMLKNGDRLHIRRGEDLFEVTVCDVGDRRLSAALAAKKYTEDPAARERRESAAEQRRLDYRARQEGQRKPDKRQRRQIVEFTRGK